MIKGKVTSLPSFFVFGKTRLVRIVPKKVSIVQRVSKRGGYIVI